MPEVTSPEIIAYASQVGELARRRGLHVAVAESLTGGHLASALARTQGASDWFRGGIVAYQSIVKFDLLAVAPGPVVNATTAASMAVAAVSMFRADFAVATTGVGGPGAEEGRPAGTVFLAVADSYRVVETGGHAFRGGPAEILAETILMALLALTKRMSEVP